MSIFLYWSNISESSCASTFRLATLGGGWGVDVGEWMGGGGGEWMGGGGSG